MELIIKNHSQSFIIQTTLNQLNQMFFAPFDEVERNEQSNFGAFYSKLTFSFKLLFTISFGFVLHNLITMRGLELANIPSETFSGGQLWRIFTAPFATIDGIYGFISIIISFWWLLSLFPQYERKYSSIHLLLQFFTQNCLIQLIYGLVVSLLVQNTYFYETYNDYFFSIGWIPIVIIWIFKYTGEHAQEKVNFCFLPFLVKNKYLAWIISICLIILTIQKTPLIIATLVGAIQYQLFHRSAIRLPFLLHVILEKPFLLFSRCFTSFITIQSVRNNLQSVCCGGKKQQTLIEEHTLDNIEMKNQSQLFSHISFKEKSSIDKKQSQIQLNKPQYVLDKFESQEAKN